MYGAVNMVTTIGQDHAMSNSKPTAYTTFLGIDIGNALSAILAQINFFHQDQWSKPPYWQTLTNIFCKQAN